MPAGLVALVCGCVAIASVAMAQPSERAGSRAATEADVVPGSYIVVYDDDAERVRAETVQRERELGFESGQRYNHALDGFAARLAPGQVRKLERDPEVDFVSEDRQVTATADVPLAAGEPTPPTGVRRVLAATATTAREASASNVAVIDTGIQLDHSDLNAADGMDCVEPGTPAVDGNGHGTHVAGTIAARNNGAGVVGVAPGTKTYAVRVLNDSGSGTWSQVICGIDWVTANAGSLDIHVANMSLGGGGPQLQPCATTTDALHAAICNSTAAGVTYAVAAGNAGWDFDYTASPDVPAAYPEALTVTAVTDSDGAPGGTGGAPSCRNEQDDAPASFSNYAATAAGRAHAIAAPGVCIRSTWPGGSYRTISGTSMASPHIAGLVALCVDEAGADGECANRTPAEVIDHLRAEADSYNTANPNYGFLRDPLHSPTSAYYGFLAQAPGAGPPPPTPPPPAPPAPPANDGFGSNHDLGGQQSASASGTNLGATKESGEPNHGSESGGASVWYRWTAPTSGEYSIELCESDYDTLLGVYTGSSVGSLTKVTGNDDACGLGSRVSFSGTAGVTYRIAVDGWRGSGVPDQGAIELDLNLEQADQPPAPAPSPGPGPLDPPPAATDPPATDTDPPDTTIARLKTRLAGRGRAAVRFRLVSSESESRFRCALDGAPFAACRSPFKARVKRGPHSLRAVAIDAAGNADPTPASHTWRVKRRRGKR